MAPCCPSSKADEFVVPCLSRHRSLWATGNRALLLDGRLRGDPARVAVALGSYWRAAPMCVVGGCELR